MPYCIVGCGYKAYTWPIDKQGTSDPAGNKFGVDLSKQQGPETEAWYAPAMYNVVRQNGTDVQVVIKPDVNCVVNSGLGSIRGARMAEMSYSPVRSTEQQRLTAPMVWRYGQMQPTSWEDALDLVARVTAAVIADQGERRPVRLGIRSRRCRWWIREYLGHRKALFRRHEDKEHSDP